MFLLCRIIFSKRAQIEVRLLFIDPAADGERSAETIMVIATSAHTGKHLTSEHWRQPAHLTKMPASCMNTTRGMKWEDMLEFEDESSVYDSDSGGTNSSLCSSTIFSSSSSLETINSADAICRGDGDSPCLCKKRVHFSVVEVREYSVELGDHPSCSKGPPLTLGWDYAMSTIVAVDDFVSSYRSSRELIMPVWRRKHLLREVARLTNHDFEMYEKERQSSAKAVFLSKSQNSVHNLCDFI